MLTIDQPSLDRELARFGAQMARYSDELGQDARGVVKRQTGLLMRELTNQLPPASRKRLESVIGRDVRSVFHGRSKFMFKGTKAGDGDIVWLDASQEHITGVRKSMYRPGSNAAQMAAIYKEKRGKMGTKYDPIGRRGRQKVQLLDRFVVNSRELAKFELLQRNKAGKLKASFALAWDAIAPDGRKPAKWVMRHAEAGTAKGTYVNGLDVPGFPQFTIISRSAGCESAVAAMAIYGALKTRTLAIQSDIKNWFAKRNK
jgi:hypothetical protein